jgi:hypothetical protein
VLLFEGELLVLNTFDKVKTRLVEQVTCEVMADHGPDYAHQLPAMADYKKRLLTLLQDHYLAMTTGEHSTNPINRWCSFLVHTFSSNILKTRLFIVWHSSPDRALSAYSIVVE